MKEIKKAFYFSLLILIMPIVLASGQAKNNEQKIKVVVDDGSETKVVIDTIIRDRSFTDSIVVNDGTVIIMNRPRHETALKHKKSNSHYIVTYTDDGNDEGKVVRIICSDSLHKKESVINGIESCHICCRSQFGHDCRSNKTAKGCSKIHGCKRERACIESGRASDRDIDKDFHIYVSDNDPHSIVEKTRFVIAKDGVIVTIESNDNEKATGLREAVENQLKIIEESKKNKEIINNESKKETMK